VLFWIAVVWLVLIIALAVFASVLPLDSPTQVFACIPNSARLAPSARLRRARSRHAVAHRVRCARLFGGGLHRVFIGLVFGGTAGWSPLLRGKTDLIISSR